LSADKQPPKQTKTPEKIEKHGLVTDVIVSGVAGTAAGAANAIVSNAINKPKPEKEKDK
jgi:hypothetical protein